MKIVHEPHLGFPYCYLSLYFAGGPMFDPPGLEGLTELTNRMLLRGTTRRGRAALEEAVEGLGTELITSTQGHAVGLAGAVLSRFFEPFAELLAEVVGMPALDLFEIDKVKREMQSELETARDADGALARIWFRRLLFPGHPLGHGTTGTEASLGRIDAAAVRQHYEQTYTQGRLTVAAAGALSRDALEAGLAPLHALPHGQTLAWDLPPVPRATGRRVALIDKPDRSQAQIFIGQPAVDAAHDDYLALHLGLTAFGGTFTSRLMQEIRVKRGLSYGAYARLATERVGGYTLLTAAPEAEDVPLTLALLFDELSRFVDDGLDDEEIAFAQGYLINTYPFSVETPALRAAQRVRAHLLGRSVDFVDQYVDAIRALTPAQVRAAVRRHVHPGDQTAVVVCTADEQRAAVEALPQVDALAVYDYCADDAFAASSAS